MLLLSLTSLQGVNAMTLHKTRTIEVLQTNVHWSLNIQMNVWSIDTKTDTLSTSHFGLYLWTFENAKNLSGAIFKSDRSGSSSFVTESIDGTERRRFSVEYSTDPTKVSPWEWRLHSLGRCLGLGSPFDRYEFSVLIALNETINLEINNTDFRMPTTLQGNWDYTENLERFADVPSKGTLSSHGFDLEAFASYRGNEMVDFFLFTVVIQPKSSQILRSAIVFLFPPITILILLSFVSYRYRRLDRSDILTVYLAVAFFILPFLLSFYQYAQPTVFTWQEVLFLFDFCFATALVIYTILNKSDSKKNLRRTQPKNNKRMKKS